MTTLSTTRTAPATELMAALHGAEPAAFGANRPILLDDPKAAWLVVEGEVDLFAVGVAAGKPAGRRMFVGTLGPGDVILGVGTTDGDEPRSLLAVCDGAKLSSIDRAAFFGLLSGGSLADRAIAMLDRWLGTLYSPFPGTERQTSPQIAHETPVDAPQSAAAGQRFAAERGICWAHLTSGNAAFDGIASISLDSTAGWVPFDRNAVLAITADATIAFASTATIAADPRAIQIDAIHRRILIALASLSEAEVEAVDRQVAARAKLDEQSFAHAIAEVRRVLDPKAPIVEPGEVDQDLLLAACRIAGEQQGIVFTAPPGWSSALSSDPVGAIARASGVRTRPVMLRRGWWRSDSGPLVAFRAEDACPVALLQVGTSHYDLVDVRTRQRTRVTAAVATSLRPMAYSFYTPLPSTALNARDFLRFGLRGSGQDLLRLFWISVAGGLISLAIPIATGILFGSIIPNADRAQLAVIAVLLLVATAASAMFLIGRGVATLRIQGRLLARLQAAVWDRLMNLPVSFFREYSVADLSLRASGVDAIQQILSGIAATSILGLVFSVFSVGLLFFYDARLAIVAVILVLIVLAVTIGLSVVEVRLLRQVYRSKAAVSSILLQLVTGISKVRIANAEARALARWAEEFRLQAEAWLRSQHIANVQTTFNAVFPVLISMALFAFVASQRPLLSAGAFLAFVSALGQATGAILQINLTLAYALNIFPIYERLRPIITTPPEFDRASADPGPLTGAIALTGVSFRYPGASALALDGVDMEFRPGEFVAVVGPSGSGKSTMMRLLLGFDRPLTGSVLYDNKDLAGLDIRAVRAQIGVVLQDATVPAGDVLHAIIGDLPLTEEDAWRAAEAVGLADDIRRMGMGMHTIISEGATTFSGGQRQRLLLAHAVVRQPKIILLDEATSALDSVTQAAVTESLAALKATRVVIAHRLSTIRNADRIYVLHNGRVVQAGTYDALASTPGLFQDLIKRQIA